MINKNNLLRLEKKIAVITGATGNLGPIWLKALREQGATVYALVYPGNELDSTLYPFLDDPLISIMSCDVTESESLRRVAEAIYSKEKVINIVVANAGLDQVPSKHNQELFNNIYNFEQIIRTNIFGVSQTIEIFSNHMEKDKKGSIIIIGSLYGMVSPDPSFYDHIKPTFIKPPAYGASKAALLQLAKYYAVHLGHSNIRVNVLSLGGVLANQDENFIIKYSNRVPLRRMALEEDLPGPLIFLASDDSNYITGINLIVDGGFTAL